MIEQSQGFWCLWSGKSRILDICLVNLFFYVATVLLLMALPPAQAREIYIQPSVNIRTIYDDNRRLVTSRNSGGAGKSAYGVISDALARIGVRSNQYDVALNSKFSLRRYDSDVNLDSENIYLDLTSNYNLSERTQFGLTGNYTRDTSLTSELLVTGLVKDNRIRYKWSLGPQWSYLLTERQSLQASYTHQDVSYEKSAGRSSLVDYTTDTASLTYNMQWTALLRNYISLSWLSFQIPDINSQINNLVAINSSRDTTQYSISIGADYQFLPTWNASFMVGERFSNTKSDSTTLLLGQPVPGTHSSSSSSNQGLIFSFSVDKQFEVGNAGLSYSRSTSASGNGRLQVFERLQANFDHKITDHLKFALTGGINKTSNSNTRNSSSNRTYYHVTPTLSWIFNRQLNLSAGYRYRNQKYANNNEAAISNAVFLNFNYQWDKLKTQRY